MKKLYAAIFFVVALGLIQPVSAQPLHSKGKFNFLRGREAFNQKDYNGALKEFKAYVRLDSNNHQVLNYLAQTYHRLKNRSQAEKYYKMAIDKAPADSYAPLYNFNLGVLYYDQKKHDDAIPYLLKAAAGLPPAPKDFAEKKGLAYYYLAFIHYEKERWAKAKHNFDMSTQYSKDLKQGALFYYGICEYKLGNISASIERFKLAERLGTSRALTNYSKQFISRLRGAKPQSAFGLTSGFQFIYDTNIFLKPDDGPSHSTIKDPKGTLIGLILEPSYLTGLKNNWTFLGKYTFSYGYQLEEKHTRFDYYNHSGNASFMKDFSGSFGHRLTLDTYARAARDDRHDRVSSTFGQSASYYRGWNPHYATDVQLDANYNEYPPALSRNDNRNGVSYAASLLHYWKLPNHGMQLTGGFGGSLADTTGRSFDSIGFMGTVGLQYTIPWVKDMSLSGNYKVDRIKFLGRLTMTQTVSSSLSKQWPYNIGTSLAYSYIDGYGNIGDAFDYTRQLFTFNLFHQL